MSLRTSGVPADGVAIGSPMAFVLRTLAWSLGLFAAFRAPSVETHVVLPLLEIQQRLAAWYGATSPRWVSVSVECSGTDVLALLIGAILAYPAPWSTRLRGIAGGVSLVLAVNTARIGTLWGTADSPLVFDRLHRYVWPTVLVIVAGGYALGWMRSVAAGRPVAGTWGRGVPTPVRRFGLMAAAFLGLFAAAAPWVLNSPSVLSMAVWVTHAAAAALTALGITASASGNLLSTAHGAFLVSPECVATPAVALYLAAVLTVWRRPLSRGLAVLAAVPVFAALGVVRTMLVILPAGLLGSPLAVVHAFYQILAGGLAVALAALWLEPWMVSGARGGTRRRAVLGTAVGLGVALAGITVYGQAVAWAAGAVRPLAPLARGDSQGALWLLPGYQLGLLAALGVVALRPLGWRRLGTALGILSLSQIALFAALGELAAQFGITAHPLLVRGWAVGEPVLLLVLFLPGTPRASPTVGGDTVCSARRGFAADPGPAG